MDKTQLTLYLLLTVALASVAAVQMMMDQFKECTSNGVLECNLRVRKINRTTAALYGNVTLLVDLGSNFVTGFNVFHSAKGNNQYNLYPMKIPALDTCTFSNSFWKDYYPYIVPYVPEIEKPGVCPIAAKLLHFNDLVLDGAMFPPYVPPGLWKMVWKGTENGTDKFFVIEVVFKVFPNGFFGKT
ncbi:uncharacterized protein LOC120428048 [Culex pipiens pallens]|uniref:uncharacterized protein LOC120428048 n=1 Tax=Culex pipiens pallens TaxID=42434 RepID=UPI00195449B1|nr:uncharacterized protein LOC120428048 [Culex pipiens pallens]